MKNWVLDLSLLNVIKPKGQGGRLQGEEEMIFKGLEYVTLLRKKFIGRDEVHFTELQLVKLTKSLKLNYNYARFINAHEMTVVKRRHSLKHPYKKPTYEQMQEIFKEYRRYDTEVQSRRLKKLSGTTLEEYRKKKNSEKSYKLKNQRRRELTLLEKLEQKANGRKADLDFMKELQGCFAQLEIACKAMTFDHDRHKYEDLFQESVKLAIEYKHRYRIGSNMGNWVISIATNVNHLIYKRIKIRKSREVYISDHFEDGTELEIPSEDPIYDEEDNCEIIMECFNALPPHFKEILEMKMAGMSNIEISEKLGFKNENYSKTKIYNARQFLAKEIKSKSEDIIIKSTTGKYY